VKNVGRVIIAVAVLIWPAAYGLDTPAEGAPETLTTAASEYVYCPSCGAKNEAGAIYCANCGEKLPELRTEYNYCPKCGDKIDREEAYCSNCGYRLVDVGKTPGEDYGRFDRFMFNLGLNGWFGKYSGGGFEVGFDFNIGEYASLGPAAGFLIFDYGNGYYFGGAVRANFIPRTSRYPSPYFNFGAGYMGQNVKAGFWREGGSRGYTRVGVGMDLKAVPGIFPYLTLGHQLTLGGGAEKRNYFWLGIGVRFGL
jgi:DNA-directed RNA polymerase subunit RPC12/RpoP